MSSSPWSASEIRDRALGVIPNSAAKRSICSAALFFIDEAQAFERNRWGDASQDRDLVFCRPDGHPHDPDVITHQFERLAAAAGLPRIRLHDLRHGMATMALEAGVHVKVVSERLGHASVAITLDLYSHVVPAMEEDAALRIAAVVDGRAKSSSSRMTLS